MTILWASGAESQMPSIPYRYIVFINEAGNTATNTAALHTNATYKGLGGFQIVGPSSNDFGGFMEPSGDWLYFQTQFALDDLDADASWSCWHCDDTAVRALNVGFVDVGGTTKLALFWGSISSYFDLEEYGPNLIKFANYRLTIGINLATREINVDVYNSGGLVGSINYTGTPISTSSVANPTVITTSKPHGLVTGDGVTISGHSGSTPDINSTHGATVTSPTTFTIPVNVTVGGTGGKVNQDDTSNPKTGISMFMVTAGSPKSPTNSMTVRFDSCYWTDDEDELGADWTVVGVVPYADTDITDEWAIADITGTHDAKYETIDDRNETGAAHTGSIDGGAGEQQGIAFGDIPADAVPYAVWWLGGAGPSIIDFWSVGPANNTPTFSYSGYVWNCWVGDGAGPTAPDGGAWTKAKWDSLQMRLTGAGSMGWIIGEVCGTKLEAPTPNDNDAAPHADETALWEPVSVAAFTPRVMIY